MSRPRELTTTLPSPSELDNFHKCPCQWWLQDRLWIKPIGDRLPLLMGRACDHAFDAFYKKVITADSLVLWLDAYVDAHMRGKFDPMLLDPFVASTRDAFRAWITLYGEVEETVLAVQPRLNDIYRGRPDLVLGVSDGVVKVRERKLTSPFADLDLEIVKYQLGLQPAGYAVMIEDSAMALFERPVVVESVEIEFLVRSAPAYSARLKAIPAAVRRESLYITQQKKDMFRATANYSNTVMQSLENHLTSFPDYATKGVPFELIPRHPRNCVMKLGKKTYKCDYYKACEVFTDPRALPEDYIDEGVGDGSSEAATPDTREHQGQPPTA